MMKIAALQFDQLRVTLVIVVSLFIGIVRFVYIAVSCNAVDAISLLFT